MRKFDPDHAALRTPLGQRYLALGLEPERDYMDGVLRMVRRVDDRIELVAFVGSDGRAPNRVQVWTDGVPQDLAEEEWGVAR